MSLKVTEYETEIEAKNKNIVSYEKVHKTEREKMNKKLQIVMGEHFRLMHDK